MKKIITVLLTLVLIFLTGCGAQNDAKKGSRTSVIAKKYAPEHSIGLLKFSSIENLFTVFEFDPGSGLGSEMGLPEKEEFKKIIGFDPTVLSEYERIGFDTKREFGIVLTGLIIDGNEPENTSGNIGLLFPLTQNSNAYDFIKQRIASSDDKSVVMTEENGMIMIRDNTDSGVLATIKSNDDYLVLNLAVNSDETAETFFRSVGHLKDNANYKEVSKEIDLGSDIAVYFDAQEFITTNSAGLKDLSKNPLMGQNQIGSVEFLDFYRGMGIVSDLSATDLRISSVAFVEKDNMIHKMTRGKDNKSAILDIEKKPAVLLAFVFNAKEYLDYMLKVMPEENTAEFEKQVQSYKNSMDIDIKEDIIYQLAGSINLGIFDAASINMMQYNTIFNFNVRDRSRFLELLEKVAPVANMKKMDSDEISGIVQDNDLSANTDMFSVNLGMSFLYVIVSDENVSVCTSRDLAADITKKDTETYLSELEKDIAEGLKNDKNYFYIDFSETYIAVKNIYQFFAGMTGSKNTLSPGVDEFVKNFEYLYAYGNVKGEAAKSEFILKTKFTKPFFISLKEEIAKIKE
ncbi:MAG: hypothetical protein R6V47_05950 [Candidatus Delongbacteria bacterium]